MKHESLGSGADEKPAPSSNGTKGGSGEAPAQSEQQSSVKWGQTTKEDDGNKYTAYEKTNADGTTETGTQTERPDGTKTCTTGRGSEEKTAECPAGRTDEPTCQVDCARFAALAELFFCSAGAGGGSDCGQAPEGTQANPHAGPGCEDQTHETTRERWARRQTVQVNLGNGRTGYATPDCSTADRSGAPSNYGDPNDPNRGDPVDPGAYDPNDGVTDPANPGEPEELATGSIRLDMYGTLRDPVGPHGTEDEGPPGAAAEHGRGGAEPAAVRQALRRRRLTVRG